MVEKTIILQKISHLRTTNIGATELTALLTELVKDSNGVNGAKKFNKKHKIETSGFLNNCWFDVECKVQNRKVNDAKNNFSLSPKDKNRSKA